jgi:uncharacterized membrane protein required for colicin V production
VLPMDVVLVGFIGGFVFGGWRSGFLRRLLGIVFIGLSLVVGAYVRYPVGTIAGQVFPDIPADYADLVGYTIVFPVVLVALHLASNLVLRRVAVRGVAREVDAGLGALFGGIEAVLILSAAIVILDAYFGTSGSIARDVAPGPLRELTTALHGSTTVHILRDTTVPAVLAVLGPLLPGDVGTLLPGGLPDRLPFPVPVPLP